MAFETEDIPDSGGGYFKAEDSKDAVAHLIEVKGFEPQRAGNFGPKDSALVDMTIFHTQEDLDALTPSLIRKGMRVEYTVLAKDLKDLVGKATIAVLSQSKPKPGQKPAWVWRQPNNDTKAKVQQYGEKREAELAAALEAVPDFD